MSKTPSMNSARSELARRIEHWFELPMAVLGVVWLLLLVVELLRGTAAWMDTLTTAIWIVFVAEFATRLVIAPRRGKFLKRNWVTALSLALPALRVLRFARVWRVLRAGRALRAVRLARVLTSFSRGMRALGTTMRSRGFPYVVALTLTVLLLGAAGMYRFEHEGSNAAAFASFGSSLWWTAMILTTMGSEFWPQSPEGRLICLLLSTYAFAVFGYITATLASYFVGGEAESERVRFRALQDEVVALRAAVERIDRHSS